MSTFRIDLSHPSIERLRGSVALRLLGYVLLFSSAVTLVLTLIQLYFEYRQDLGTIETRLSEIERGYSGSLGESLWHMDGEQLRIQADGILRLPDISAVEIRETYSPGHPIVVTAGQSLSHSVITRDSPVSYRVQGSEQKIGMLHVEASLVETYRELMNRTLIILLSQAAKTFLVSIFIVFIFYRRAGKK
jgi:hypothetical protein